MFPPSGDTLKTVAAEALNDVLYVHVRGGKKKVRDRFLICMLLCLFVFRAEKRLAYAPYLKGLGVSHTLANIHTLTIMCTLSTTILDHTRTYREATQCNSVHTL